MNDKDDLAKIDSLEVDALSDEELGAVAGGGVSDAASCTCVSSCICCHEKATYQDA
jgi:hypothetical protein